MSAERKIIKQIKLREPVQFGEETVEQITLYKPRGKDMRVLLGATGDRVEEATINFVAKVTLQSTAVIDALDSDDWLEVMEAVGELVERGRRTGVNG